MNIRSAVQDGKLIIRGTHEWDQRELARYFDKRLCISIGPIGLSLQEQRYRLATLMLDEDKAQIL